MKNFFNVFLLFCYHSIRGKGHCPVFVKIEIPFIKGCFVPNLVEIGQVKSF